MIKIPAAAAAAVAALGVFAYGESADALTYMCAPNQAVTGMPFPSSGPYTAAFDGVVTGVAATDARAMDQAGCTLVGAGPGPQLIGRLIGANFNSTADQAIPMLIPANQGYTVTAAVIKNCSISLATAAGSFYDGAGKTGNRLAGSGTTQGYTGCSGSGTAQLVAGGTSSVVVDAEGTPPLLSLTTANGTATTANVYLYGYTVGQ